MPTILHRSCVAHPKVRSGWLRARQMARGVHQVLRQQTGLKSGEIWPGLEAPVKKLLGRAAYTDFEGAGVTALKRYKMFISSIVFDVLDATHELPDNDLAARHADDQPTYGLQAVTVPGRSTEDVLTTANVLFLNDLTELREGDTRTIIIRVADQDAQDAEGNWLLATISGCVMTIYPRALELPVGLNDSLLSKLKCEAWIHGEIAWPPQSSTNSPTTSSQVSHKSSPVLHCCECTALDCHLLTYCLSAHDIKLDRSKILSHLVPEDFFDRLLGKRRQARKCYGFSMCNLLALVDSGQAVHNADTVALLTDEICLICGYPELSSSNALGIPEEREVAVRDQHFYSARWQCFRHESRRRIQTLEGYDDTKDTALDPTDKSDIMCGPIQRREGVWQDEGLPEIQYGGDGQRW